MFSKGSYNVLAELYPEHNISIPPREKRTMTSPFSVGSIFREGISCSYLCAAGIV
jgi:hypothetical protein